MTNKTDENFVLHSTFKGREGKNIEFKDMQSPKQIPNVAAQYVTAYINARVQGSIYFGIANDREVVGVNLSESDRDKITKSIPETIQNITPILETDPKVTVDWYTSDHFPVFNPDGSIINDTYVIKLSVKDIDNPGLLYKTSLRGKCYFKGDGNKIDINQKDWKQILKERKKERAKIRLNELKDHFATQSKPERRDILEFLHLASGVDSSSDLLVADRMIMAYYPKDQQLQLKKAEAYESSGNLDSALTALEKVKNEGENEDSRKASLMRGEIYRKQHDTGAAIKEYDDVLLIDSDDYVTLYLKALTLIEELKYKDAIPLLRKSLNINPRYRVAKYELRKCYGSLKFKEKER